MRFKRKNISRLIVILLLSLLIIFIVYMGNCIHIKSTTGFLSYEPNTIYYIGYTIKNNGFLNCKIDKCYLMDVAGNDIKEVELNYDFYIDKNNSTGAYTEDIFNNRIKNFEELKNYNIKGKDSKNLVLKILFDKGFRSEDIYSIKVYYSVLGIPKVNEFQISTFQ